MNKKHQLFVIICFAIAVVGLMLLITFLSSCDDGCKTGDDRCKGSVVQLCDADGYWHDYEDCSEVTFLVDGGLVEENLVCCEEVEGAIRSSCVALDECSPSGDK